MTGRSVETDIFRRKLEEFRARIEENRYILFDNASDAIFITDVATGKILDVNKVGEDLVGLPRCDIIGMPHESLYPTKDRDRYREIFNKALASPATEIDLEVVHSSGKCIPVCVSMSCSEIKGTRVVQGTFRGITMCRHIMFDISSVKAAKEDEDLVIEIKQGQRKIILKFDPNSATSLFDEISNIMTSK